VGIEKTKLKADASDDVQFQINSKLKEHNMSVDTDIKNNNLLGVQNGN
jgi:hypothetical protein